jgi:hypothetical protein
MLRLIFLLALLSIFFKSEAQKTKTFVVARSSQFSIYGHVNYDTNGSKIDTSYRLLGKDFRYQQLVEYILLQKGTLKDIVDFMSKCEAFMKTEEDGVSDNIGENRVYVYKSMGIKYLHIYGLKEDKDGYSYFGLPQIKNVQTGIAYFAKNHKISLK